MRWKPIESFPPENWPFSIFHDGETRFYDDALVRGPTWETNSLGDGYPADGKGDWIGDEVIAVAHTYTGLDFWIERTVLQNSYGEAYIKPTHWSPFPEDE